MDRDVFGEVLSELVVEETPIDRTAARDRLKEAHTISLYLADVLAAANASLPSGEERDAVSAAQSTNIELLCGIGDVLRSVRSVSR